MDFKDHRCLHCNRLQFRYKIDGDHIIIMQKCEKCRSINIFRIKIKHSIDIQKDTRQENYGNSKSAQ